MDILKKMLREKEVNSEVERPQDRALGPEATGDGEVKGLS